MMTITLRLRRMLGALLAGAVFVCALPARADTVVVVNPQSGVEQLSRSQVINIFLGHHRELPGGLPALPVDLPPSQAEKAQFYRALVNRDLDQMAAYWSRLVFAGSTSPPFQAASVADVIQYVVANRGAVGYLDRRNVDSRVRIVLILP